MVWYNTVDKNFVLLFPYSLGWVFWTQIQYEFSYLNSKCTITYVSNLLEDWHSRWGYDYVDGTIIYTLKSYLDITRFC